MKWNIQLKFLLVMVLLSLFAVIFTSFIIRVRIQEHFHQYTLQHERSAGEGMGAGSRLIGDHPRFRWNLQQMEFLNEVTRSIYLGGIVTIIVAIFLSWIMAHRMTKPMQEMVTATKNIAAGKLDHRLNIDSDDEWGIVAKSFNSMAIQLEDKEQLRRELVANLSHELATPLTSIAGYLQAIEEGLIDKNQWNQTLQLLREESSRMKKMVEDLRELSLVESNAFQLHTQPCKIDQMMHKVLNSFSRMAQQRNIQILYLPDSSLKRVYIDPDRFYQLMINLIQNALQHSDDGKKITISTHSLDAKKYSIIIEDEGTGIEEKDLPHIFERFYRTEPSRSRVSGGTGIGLAIVKKLVESHGGKISASSQLGKGTLIKIILPRYIADSTRPNLEIG